MEAVATSLIEITNLLVPRLRRISEADAAVKPAPGKWSKKEILGHLLDSACNNHQKFIRTILSDGTVDFVGYEQDAWVSSQRYNQEQWQDIIAAWASFNRHLAHIIRHVEASKLENTITISGSGPYTLAFIMADYVEHLKHHINQIIPDSGLTSSFSMSPYV